MFILHYYYSLIFQIIERNLVISTSPSQINACLYWLIYLFLFVQSFLKLVLKLCQYIELCKLNLNVQLFVDLQTLSQFIHLTLSQILLLWGFYTWIHSFELAFWVTLALVGLSESSSLNNLEVMLDSRSKRCLELSS